MFICEDSYIFSIRTRELTDYPKKIPNMSKDFESVLEIDNLKRWILQIWDTS